MWAGQIPEPRDRGQPCQLAQTLPMSPVLVSDSFLPSPTEGRGKGWFFFCLFMFLFFFSLRVKKLEFKKTQSNVC